MFRKNAYFIAGLSVLIGIVGLVFSVLSTRAATITPGPLSISYIGDQLFNETNIEPGDIIIKDISVTNTGTLPHSFSISAGNVSGNLASVLQIEPRENGVAVWNETLSNLGSLRNGSKVIIPSINPGATRSLQIAAIFPSNSDNEFQGQKSANFDFAFGSESTDQVEPTNFALRINRSIEQSIASAISEDTREDNIAVDLKLGDQANGEAKGAATTLEELCFWWVVLLVILIIVLFFYHKYIKNIGRFMFWWLWPLAIAAALYFAHDYLNRDLTGTIFCTWLWVIELVVLIAYYIYELKTGAQ